MPYQMPDDAARKGKLLRYRAVGLNASSLTMHKALQEELQTGRAALAEHEDWLSSVLASATHEAILTLDSQGCVTSWNSGAERILGWTEANAIGLDGAMIYTPAEREAGVPAAELQAAATKGHVDSERWMQRRDGTRFWATLTLTPLLGKAGRQHGFLKILRDRTGRHLAEMALARSKARLRRMNKALEAEVTQRTKERDHTWQLSQDLLVVVRPDATLAAVNPAWSTTLGWTEAELLGRSVFELVHPDDREATLAELGRLASGLPTLCFLNRNQHRDGSWRWFTWSAVPDGGLSYATGRDVTAERAASRALRVAQEQLHQSQKLETMGQLTGGIAHDFNNLLQGIGSNLDMVQHRLGQGRAAEAGRYVETTHKGVDRAAALTARLLAFARRQQVSPDPVTPAALVLGLMELVERTMGSAVEVELRLQDSAWPVLCDPSGFESALLNLAINARDAMPKGGRLTIGTRHVQLCAADLADQDGAAPGDYVETTVADTGTGMTPDVLARALEPFFTTKPVGQGTGLGLSQLHGFVRQSAGALQVESAPGQGTTVRFSLPRHEVAPTPSPC